MNFRRRSLTLTVALFLALLISSTWLGAPATPTARAQIKPRVVYVYNNDLAAHNSFKTLLEMRGFEFVSVTLAALAAGTYDFSSFQAIIVADDTGDETTWFGSGAASRNIELAGKYTIGVGYGGSTYFQTRNLLIGRLNSWIWLTPSTSAYPVSPGDTVWSTPNPLGVASGSTVKLYNLDPTFRAVFDDPANPLPADVIRIGRQVDDPDHYPLIAQPNLATQQPVCNLLWGFRRAPGAMTPAGRNFFENVLRGTPCTPTKVSPVDVSITKTSDKSGKVGEPLTYTLQVKNNSGATAGVVAPAVKVIDTLPAGVAFVSASSTQGSCSYAAGKVTCLIGDMAGGATVTITIVVKPTEAGTPLNSATVSAHAADPNPGNNSASVETPVSFTPQFPPITALPYKPIFTGPIVAFPTSDLSVFGIEVTQGIQCFDTSKGLAGCPDNSLPLVGKKDATARIYLRVSGSLSSLNNVPVRLLLEDANGVQYTVNTSGRALTAISQGSAADSANVYFNVNFSSNTFVKFRATVDPNNTFAETNETNNSYPSAAGFMTLNFSKRSTMKIVGQRLRYHPSGYSGSQYAGGWAVNGGAADWYEQLLPIRNNGINYVVKSGYQDWTTTLNTDGQHALIQNLNLQWMMENTFSWLFGTGTFTGARHIYGWAPSAGYSGGHADMPIYPHAGGLGVVGIGSDAPGSSTDNPGSGALIFGHELTHDYNVKHTNTADSCGSSDSSTDFPYGTSSIQEYGFNPFTGKVYDPANTHDLMSYCPAGGSKLGWISPFTWQRMFNNLNASLAAEARALQLAPESVLVVNVAVTNPALGPQTGAFGDLFKVDASAPLIMPAAGDYAIQLLDGGDTVLSTVPFSVTFKSEYSGHGGGESGEPGDPAERPAASAEMTIPWVDGTAAVVLMHGNAELSRKPVSANAPIVQITSPSAAVTWTAGTTETLTWDAADPDAGDTLSYSVFYSHNGADWALLAGGLTATSYDIAVDTLAGGANAQFRVVASDGVNIGEDATDFPINVPDQAPIALILSPDDEGQVLPGDLLVLQGTGNDMEDGTLPDVSLVWSSDKQGVLGAGASLAVNTLQPGPHTITLTVTDSQGQSAQTTVDVYVGAKLFMPIVLR